MTRSLFAYAVNTKANILAGSYQEGALGYATDTNEFGHYNGAAWVWGVNGGDHTALTNIGTNTHAQIDTALTRLANTSGTNTGDATVSDTASVDLTITGQLLSANVLPGGVDHNSLLNYAANRHFLQTDIDHVSAALATGLVTVTTGSGALGSTANNTSNWDTAYSWGNHASAGYLLSSTADTTFLKLNAANSPVTGNLDINAQLTVGVTQDIVNLGVTGRLRIDAITSATVEPALEINTYAHYAADGQYMGLFSKMNTVAGQLVNQAGAIYTVLYHDAGFNLADWRGIETGGAYVHAGSSITMATGLYAALPNAWQFGGSIGTAAAIWMPGSNATGIGTVWSILQTGSAPSYWNGTFNMENNSLPIDAWRSGGATQMRFSDYADSATAGPKIVLRHARDTYASPDPVLAGDWIGALEFWPYINGDFRQTALVRGYAGGTISATSYSTGIEFRATPTNSTTLTQMATLIDSVFTVLGTLQSSIATGGQLYLNRADASVNNGDLLGGVYFRSTDANATAAKIEAYAPAAHTGSSASGDLVLSTVPSGSVTHTEWMRIKSTGAIAFGTGPFSNQVFAVDKTAVDFFDSTSLGADLVTNGNFGSATGWTAVSSTLDVSTGKAVITCTVAGNFYIYQGITTVANRLYKITVSFSGTLSTAASPRVRFGSSAAGTQYGDYLIPFDNISTDGTYSYYIVPTTTTTYITLLTASGVTSPATVMVWDDVIAKEITGGKVISRGIFSGGGTAGLTINTLGEAGLTRAMTIAGTADQVQLDVRPLAGQAADTARFGDGTTNYAAFEADGTLKFVGTATFWEDIDFPLVAKTTGANTPSYQTLTGNLTMLRWAVNDALQCDTEEFVHAWKEASAATWHIHIITNGLDAASRYVRFEVEYTWANFNSALPATATITSADLLIPANTTDRTHLIFDIGSFTPAGGKIGAHVKARIKRVAAVGTAPTNDPFAELVQLHIECDTLGSRLITTK